MDLVTGGLAALAGFLGYEVVVKHQNPVDLIKRALPNPNPNRAQTPGTQKSPDVSSTGFWGQIIGSGKTLVGPGTDAAKSFGSWLTTDKSSNTPTDANSSLVNGQLTQMQMQQAYAANLKAIDDGRVAQGLPPIYTSPENAAVASGDLNVDPALASANTWDGGTGDEVGGDLGEWDV